MANKKEKVLHTAVQNGCFLLLLMYYYNWK